MKIIRSKPLRKVMQYTKPYQSRFNWVIIWAVLLSIFAATRPYIFKEIIDKYLNNAQDKSDFIFFVSLMATILIAEVVMQFFFTYWANWLGQDIIKDIRDKLFHHISSFKMKYFDNEPVGKLVTRTVSDIESIASIFSQGLFMIVSDVLKMLITLISMLYTTLYISLIAVAVMPII